MSVHNYSLKWEINKTHNTYTVAVFRVELGKECLCCGSTRDAVDQYAFSGSFRSNLASLTQLGYWKYPEDAYVDLIPRTLLLCDIAITRVPYRLALKYDLFAGILANASKELTFKVDNEDTFVCSYLSPLNIDVVNCSIEAQRS